MDRDFRRQNLIEAAQKAALENGGVLMRSDFVRITGISKDQIHRLFPDGGWSKLLQLAGIPEHPTRRLRISNEEFFSEMHRVITELGKIPTKSMFTAASKYSSETLSNRIGGWEKVLEAYEEWRQENQPNASSLQKLDGQIKQVSPRHSSLRPNSAGEESQAIRHSSGILYGELINFRGLQHAPINEQGVVYLFGMVSHELGFLIESVQSGYPDCHGKRKVRGGRWQPVRIEFEYQSRNFLTHGHDPSQCDLIVCWEHNWPECPLEVICLKERIKSLKPSLE